MNEWPPKGFYSGSTATDQRPQTRIYRQCWEENWDQGRVKTMNCYRIREYQKSSAVLGHEYVTDDVMGIPLSYSSKKKKNGASDPRFKRVLNPESRNDLDLNAEKLSSLQKISLTVEDRIEQTTESTILADKMISYLKTPDDADFYGVANFAANFGKFPRAASLQKDIFQQEMVTKDVGFDAAFLSTQKDANKKSKLNSKANLKKSASDCTMHTKRTLGEDNDEDYNPRARPYPSVTRMQNVHTWMKGQKCPEKRRSVITVIGQTQTKPFSTVLTEINQRRKLAKELDKHALCEAIVESSETSAADLNNLVAKVKFMLPNGKILYSAEKVYKCNEKEPGKEAVTKSVPESALDTNDPFRKKCDMIPERDSSSQVGRRNKNKRSTKKPSTSLKEKSHNKVPGDYKAVHFSWKLVVSLLIVASFVICATAFFFVLDPRDPFPFSEFFVPKTSTWYEKLFY